MLFDSLLAVPSRVRLKRGYGTERMRNGTDMAERNGYGVKTRNGTDMGLKCGTERNGYGVKIRNGYGVKMRNGTRKAGIFKIRNITVINN